MPGSPSGGTSGSAGPRGLAACGRCRDVVPASRLVAHGDRNVCPDCLRRLGPVDPPPAPDATASATVPASATATAVPVAPTPSLDPPGLPDLPAGLVASRRSPSAPAPPAPGPRPGADDPYGHIGTRAARRTTISGDLTSLTGDRTTATGDPAPSTGVPVTAAGPTPSSVHASAQASASGTRPGDDAPRPGPVSRERVPPRPTRVVPTPAPAPSADVVARGLPPARRGVAAPRPETGSRPQVRSWEEFAAYAEMRRRIDAGDDTVETRRDAADLAVRLGLLPEAAQLYQRCLELDPHDERSRQALDSLRHEPGPPGSAPPDRDPAPVANGPAGPQSSLGSLCRQGLRRLTGLVSPDDAS